MPTGSNSRDIRKTKPRFYATPQQPERDPVAIYKKYQSVRPCQMSEPDSLFFLAVNYNCKCGSPWYKKLPMGINRLYQIMTDLKTGARIENTDKHHTSHRYDSAVHFRIQITQKFSVTFYLLLLIITFQSAAFRNTTTTHSGNACTPWSVMKSVWQAKNTSLMIAAINTDKHHSALTSQYIFRLFQGMLIVCVGVFRLSKPFMVISTWSVDLITFFP